MTGVRIETRIDATAAGEAFARLARVVADPEPVLRAIGTGGVSLVQDRFQTATDPDGNPWQALNPAYAAEKRGPGILRESGMRGGLMASITFQTTRDSVAWGTNKVHALIHQVGGTITPKRGNRLVFSIGGATVFAKSVTIPARPYLGIGPKEGEMMLDVVEGALDRAGVAT
jgi:phage virion morphogenesis protein